MRECNACGILTGAQHCCGFVLVLQESSLLRVMIEMQMRGLQCDLGRFESVKSAIEKTLKRMVSGTMMRAVRLY